MKLKFLNELADIVVSIDEGKRQFEAQKHS